MRLFAEQLPSMPLFVRVKAAATRPHVLNYKIDATQPSSLWNLYEIDVDE